MVKERIKWVVDKSHEWRGFDHNKQDTFEYNPEDKRQLERTYKSRRWLILEGTAEEEKERWWKWFNMVDSVKNWGMDHGWKQLEDRSNMGQLQDIILMMMVVISFKKYPFTEHVLDR